MYQVFFRLVLQRLDPERAHALAKRALRIARSTRPGRAVVRRLVGPPDPRLATEALGLRFPTPLGVAAGVDKDATWFGDLAALGFGFVEVGTITALPQEGNTRPRIQRFVGHRAILNRLGSPNPGAENAAARLERRTQSPIVGVNIGKSKAAPIEAAADDYRAAARRLAATADYLALNVSSPNTPGLRELQGIDQLRSLIGAVRDELAAIEHPVPLLIKIDPDLEDDHLDAIVALALELELDGIVAVNTTVDRGVLGDSAAGASLQGGGVSGEPLRERAMTVLCRIRRIAGDRLLLISVGGVGSPDDVWERILAGATLVQVHTAFIYEGPGWPRRVNRALARRLRRAGISSIQELVGSGERGDAGRDRPLDASAQQRAVGTPPLS